MEKIKKKITLIPKKKIIGTIKLLLPTVVPFDSDTIGKVSRAISQFKIINIADLTKKYTKVIEKQPPTKGKIPVKIIIFNNGVYEIQKKSMAIADIIREMFNIKKINSMKNTTNTSFYITREQLIEIGKKKQDDLITKNFEDTLKCIEGTLKSMRILIKG